MNRHWLISNDLGDRVRSSGEHRISQSVMLSALKVEATALAQVQPRLSGSMPWMHHDHRRLLNGLPADS